MRDGRFGFQVGEVEGGDFGRLGAGTGRGRYRQERLERRRWLVSATYGRVDVLYYGGGMRGDEVRDLGGVQTGAPTDANEAVEGALHSEICGLLEGFQSRFDVDAIKDFALDIYGLYNLPDLACYSSLNHAGIGDDHYTPGAKPLHLPPGLLRNATTERYRGGLQPEGPLAVRSWALFRH